MRHPAADKPTQVGTLIQRSRRAGRATFIALFILGLQSYVALPAFGQQVVSNFGKFIEYEHSMKVYDTIDRNADTITQMGATPTTSELKLFNSNVLDATTGSVSGHAYELASLAEGSTTFDMKASSGITFTASSEGSYDPETAPDGAWDYVDAHSHTISTYYDSVTLTGPADQTGDPATFYMHWKAKNNQLFFEQTTTETSSEIIDSGDITLGNLTKLNNGFFTNMSYTVTMEVFANEQEQSPYTVTKLEPFLPPQPGDTLPLTQTIDLDDIDLIYEVPAKINEEFTLQVDLSALLDMDLFATSPAQPTVFSRLDLSQTFDSVAFQVRDQSGNIIPGIGIQSQIGINYAGAAPTAVPEPSAGFVLLMLTTVLAGIRRYAMLP